MSRVDELIRELCPDGVERVQLGEIAELKRGTSISKKNMQPGEIPVIAGGLAPAYYIDQSNREGEVIVVAGSGANAGFVSFWDEPVFVSDAFSIQSDDDHLLLKYAFHALKSKQDHLHDLKKGGGVPHVYAKDVAGIQIPLPPLQVQEEIVRILDQFAELDRELEQEIAGREKQFGIVRDKLLMLEDFETVKLGEIGSVAMCKRIFKKETDDTGDVPFYKIGTFGKVADSFISQELFEEYKSKYPYPEAGDLLLSASGSIGRVVEFDGSASYFQDSNIVWLKHDETVLKNSFLKYCYQIIEWTTEGGTIKRLYNKNILDAEIPLPPLETQQEIAAKLDTFTEYIDNLKRERELRQKQYEYYRDRLLDFPVKE